MKKCLPIIFAALLMVSALTGCASQTGLAQRNSSPEQNNSTAPGGETSISQPVASTTGASSPTISPNTSAAYEKLIAYKTEGYGQQSIADFNTTLASTPDELTEFLAAVADVISTISPSDENYAFFTTTITFSSQELYCEHMGEELRRGYDTRVVMLSSRHMFSTTYPHHGTLGSHRLNVTEASKYERAGRS